MNGMGKHCQCGFKLKSLMKGIWAMTVAIIEWEWKSRQN